MILYSTSLNNKLYIYKNKIYVKYTRENEIDDIDFIEIILLRHLHYPKYKLIPVSKLFYKEEDIFFYYDAYIITLITKRKDRYLYKLVGFVTYYPFTAMFLFLLLGFIFSASGNYLMR